MPVNRKFVDRSYYFGDKMYVNMYDFQLYSQLMDALSCCKLTTSPRATILFLDLYMSNEICICNAFMNKT